MKLKALTSALFLISTAAAADPMGFRPDFFVIPPREAVAVVRAAGFIPVSRPAREGPGYAVRAVDPYGTPVLVMVDGRAGYVVSVRRLGAGPGPGFGRPELLGPVPRDAFDRLSPPRPIPARPARRFDPPENRYQDPPAAATIPSATAPPRLRPAEKPASAAPARPSVPDREPKDAKLGPPPKAPATAAAAPGSSAEPDRGTITQSIGPHASPNDGGRAATDAFPPVTPLQ